MKDENDRLYEFRVCYNEGAYHSAVNSYHYYQAYRANDALDFHCKMMEKRNIDCQIISVERKCPWRNRWLNESNVLQNES